MSTPDDDPDASAGDRRGTVRRRATLPFSWRGIDENASMAEICRALGVPDAAVLRGRLAELDEELERVCAAIDDSRVGDALRVLNAKLSVLEESLLSHAPLPPGQSLTISAEGVGFESSEPLPVGAWLAVHLVLPVSDHVVCRARVSHCRTLEPARRGCRIGAELHGVDGPTARRLTRFAITRARQD